MPAPRHDVMDDVLTRMDDRDFEMGPGFSTHAPMAAEALVTMGYPQEAVAWIDAYVHQVPHHPRPAPTARINPRVESDWRNARGDRRRLGDWAVLFQEELEEAPWQDVLGRWWPRLLPGTLGGLTHGLIRTAHAVRSLAADPAPSARVRRELAEGLAYWAAVYAPLPSQPRLQGSRSVQQAIAALPPAALQDVFGAAGSRRTGAQATGGDPLADFERAVDELTTPVDVDQALLALTRAFADLLRCRTASNPVPVVHTVTAPAAARMLLPYLPAGTHQQTYASVWQAAAAISAAFGAPGAVPEHEEREPLSPAELSARAANHGAAHAIKLTEACLREYRDNPDPVYLFTAEDVLPRIARDRAD